MYDKLEDRSREDSHENEAEDRENLLSSSDDAEPYPKPARRSPWWQFLLAIVLSSLVAGLGGIWVGRRMVNDPASVCPPYVSQYCKCSACPTMRTFPG